MGRVLERLEELVLVLTFAVMTVVAFINVITRYFIRYSLAFTEELVVSLFVWLTLLGTAIAFRQGAHLGFEVLAGRLPRPVRRVLLWVSAATSMVLFVALVYYGILQIRSERLLGTTSEALAIPQWWYTLGIPVFGVLVVVRIVQGALRADRKLARE